ncbi:hypothetical protein BCEN4_370087 [Burkholderia cenocepacia]|nr:hypothetical protein BCEN4_370087 [Burkholderia cenocepacia]
MNLRSGCARVSVAEQHRPAGMRDAEHDDGRLVGSLHGRRLTPGVAVARRRGHRRCVDRGVAHTDALHVGRERVDRRGLLRDRFMKACEGGRHEAKCAANSEGLDHDWISVGMCVNFSG